MTWFVMRDLTRANSLEPAHVRLSKEGFDVFTPMQWKLVRRHGRTERRLAPVIHDLLFVNTSRDQLDPAVRDITTLQYRYVKGGRQGEAMTVSDPEMERFIKAVTQGDNPRYYAPGEILPEMVGRPIRIMDGTLKGMTGHLLKIRGARKRRVLVEIPGMLCSSVEVSKDFIEFTD